MTTKALDATPTLECMKTPRNQEKATRIHEDEYHLTDCPVCEEKIVGTLTVEVYLGEVRVAKVPGGPEADVDVKTRMRSLAVQHRCLPRAMATEEPEDEVEADDA